MPLNIVIVTFLRLMSLNEMSLIHTFVVMFTCLTLYHVFYQKGKKEKRKKENSLYNMYLNPLPLNFQQLKTHFHVHLFNKVDIKVYIIRRNI